MFDQNPQQCSALECPSNMSSRLQNVTRCKIMIYQFMNRINGCVCEHEKVQYTLTFLTSLGIFSIVFSRKTVKVKASAVYPGVRETGNTEEIWGCCVGDGRMQRVAFWLESGRYILKVKHGILCLPNYSSSLYVVCSLST